jgi:hypothetical protein
MNRGKLKKWILPNSANYSVSIMWISPDFLYMFPIVFSKKLSLPAFDATRP